MGVRAMYLLYFFLACVQAYVLAASSANNRGGGCDYEGQWVESGTVVWEDPECECTQLVCIGYQVELVKKAKPCCKYHHTIFGNGETIKTGACQEIVCKSGNPVSLPRCPKDYVPLSYNDCVGCYNISMHEMNHYDAMNYCDMMGGRLVEITTEGEEKALEWYLFKYYYKMGVTSYWTGGSRDGYQGTPVRAVFKEDPHPFTWASLYGIPVEAIHDDFCHNQPNPDPTLSALQLSYYDYGGYCWCNESPSKHNRAICETCTHEKSYQTNCIYKDKVYAHKEMMDSVNEAPGPCFMLMCYNGKSVKIEKACQQENEDPNYPDGPPLPSAAK